MTIEAYTSFLRGKAQTARSDGFTVTERAGIPSLSYELHCMDALQFMATLPDGAVDAVITDPPYGTQELAGGYGRRQLWDNGDGNGRVIENDIDLSLIEAAYPHFGRLVTSGWAAVFYAARKTPEFVEATSGDDWFGSVVWDKGAPGLGYHIRYSHEDIAIFRYGEPERPENPLLSVIRCPRLAKHHPHEKPVQLMKRLVAWLTKPGDTVFDPFCGLASTGVAALQLGRRFIGCEISPEYHAIGLRRLQDAAAQLPLPFALDA